MSASKRLEKWSKKNRLTPKERERLEKQWQKQISKMRGNKPTLETAMAFANDSIKTAKKYTGATKKQKQALVKKYPELFRDYELGDVFIPDNTKNGWQNEIIMSIRRLKAGELKPFKGEL